MLAVDAIADVPQLDVGEDDGRKGRHEGSKGPLRYRGHVVIFRGCAIQCHVTMGTWEDEISSHLIASDGVPR